MTDEAHLKPTLHFGILNEFNGHRSVQESIDAVIHLAKSSRPNVAGPINLKRMGKFFGSPQ